MPTWSPYASGRAEHTVSGTVLVCPDVYSSQLDNARDIFVYLPPSYASSSRRYPVIYMQDGQNVFDAVSSFAGEWHVDETFEELHDEGLEAAVVAIPNIGDARITEYNPYTSTRFGAARGDDYVRFICNTLKPMIDAEFRTLPGSDSTAIAGSSMGGLISLYAWLAYPQVFGLGAAMSPALWIARGAALEHAGRAPLNVGRLYLDIGGKELPRRFSKYVNGMNDAVQGVYDRLRGRGIPESRLMLVRDKHGEHNEESWARRFPDAIRFLLGGGVTPQSTAEGRDRAP
ncbi:MAG: alpha/beta hydrolase [Chloroflexi bacterium]|nr:alpha/beta hydrolase [Chloroflexota bacterium]